MSYSIEKVTEIVDQHFPQARDDVGAYIIEALPPMGARVRLPIHDRFIRPGGSVSGPTMFKLADLAVYIALIGERGEAAIAAVTSSVTINFLSRPQPADLVCDVKMLRMGRRLAVAEAALSTVGQDDLVGHAICTYALPTQ